MPGAAAVAGGLSLVGGWMANRGRAKEAEKNRQFQERMRNTQWQAAVSDMEQAGLNPALAYSQGPNAAPGGSMAQQQDIVSPAVSSAMQARRLREDVKNLESQRGLMKAQTLKALHEGKLQSALAESAKAKAQLDTFRTNWLLGPETQGRIGDGPWVTSRDSQNYVDTLLAELDGAINRAKREGATARTMEPLAKLADELGVWLPVMALGGGIAGAAGGLGVAGARALAGWKKTRAVRKRGARALKDLMGG